MQLSFIMDMQAAGNRIKELRYNKGIKVRDIVECIGVSENSVMKWQRGDCLPSPDNMFLLCKMLGTTMEYVIAGEEEEGESPLLPLFKGYIGICCISY